MRCDRFLIVVLALITMMAVSISLVFAEPSGPGTFDEKSTQTRIQWGAKTMKATAGNVTMLEVNGESTTRFWQGYYGNITGKIVLSDANNKTMYEWTMASPKGEVYATRGLTIDWSNGNINCSNLSHISNETVFLRADPLESLDAVSLTFNETIHPGFYVGAFNISNDTCYATYTYVNSAKQYGQFSEVLLQDSINDQMIYTAIITQDTTGFDDNKYDFQMIVGEPGSDGDTEPSDYYFYVELN